ncbi:MAG: hypothetical protein LAQ69_23920 [Acidobacteriia bacterium]|nr:hypothetical protein [Terriglobia bacterium]
MKKLMCSMLLAAFCLFADVNVTGKWTGSFDMSGPQGESKTTTALLDLKQNGKEITGTVGPNEDERFAIQKGQLEGDKITLEVEHDGGAIKFNLVVDGDHIKGEASGSHDGQNLKAKLDVTRAK